jgi:hypothetical protein
MRRILVFSLVLVSYLRVSAQNQGPTCAQTLRLARATYEQGRLQEIEFQLQNCLKSSEEGGFSKDEKQLRVEAYKILCLSYIYLEEAEKADDAMMNILKTDPYFQINDKVDPAEFVALYKTFRYWPIFRVGVSLGGNFSQPNVSEVVATDGGSASYKNLFGLQLGFVGDYPLRFLSKQLTLHGEILYTAHNFELTTSLPQGDGDKNSTLATESQSWLSVPITIQYSIFKQNEYEGQSKKINPFVSLGVSTDLRFGASIEAERTRGGQSPVEPKNYDVKDQRNAINLSAIAGIGAKTKIAGGLLSLEFRYQYGLTDVTSIESGYETTDIYLTHGVPQTIYTLNALSIAVNYAHNIFKPKKLTKRK